MNGEKVDGSSKQDERLMVDTSENVGLSDEPEYEFSFCIYGLPITAVRALFIELIEKVEEAGGFMGGGFWQVQGEVKDKKAHQE